MAENRNWGSNRSSDKDWDEENDRYSQRGRYEGGQGNDWNRSDQEYGKNSMYGEGRYDRDYDQRHGSNYSDNERNYSEYGNSERGRSGGSFGFGESGFRSRYDRERQSYSPGGYQNYGGGSGYGSNQWTGGYGGSNYGRSYGNNYGTGRGRGSYGDYSGSSSYGQGDYNRGSYGSSYGENYLGRNYGDRSYGSGYGGNRETDYRGRQKERGWWDRTSDEISSWFGDEEAERRRRMDRMYKGRGPKNYQRSDDRIKEDINDRLSDDWFVDASDIDVSVQNGEVTLTGNVDERTSKRRAEDIAESVSGVKHVENRLRVTSWSSTGSYTGTSSESSLGASTTSTVGSATGTTGLGSTTRSRGTVNENK